MRPPKYNKLCKILDSFDEDKEQLLHLIVVLLIDDARKQIERGRLGPKDFEFSNIVREIKTGKMKIKIIPGNPSYPELRFCP